MSKEIYAPVDGKAQKITRLYAPVNGVARSVKKAYKGVNGIARQVFAAIPPILPTFADNTWEAVIAACQLGIVPDTWAVGNQKSMTIDGVDYLVDIIGKNHDDYARGGGKAPLTFQLHNSYDSKFVMNETQTNTGGWRDSQMRSTYIRQIFNLMPQEVQNAIKEVYKLTSIGAQSSLLSGTSDKLFLLSDIEVFGANVNSFSGEGQQYEYYAQGNSKHKKVNNIAAEWWTRSPNRDGSGSFCVVSDHGNSEVRFTTTPCGVSVAFCF